MKPFLFSDFRWFISLGAKFARVVPGRTFSAVLLTLLSQVSSIAAFFLPLKVVILLGSEGMPTYFPSFLAEFSRDMLVVGLTVATIGFYIIHTIAEKLIDFITGSAANLLLARSQKIVLFENQLDVASNAYQSFSRALSGIVFSALAILFLLVFYPEMAWVIAGYLLLSATVVLVACAYSEKFLYRIRENLNSTMGVLSALGFFSVFGFLVIDFLWLEAPGFILAIISILLGRQTFSRLSACVVGLFKLSKNRHKLDVLFFHGKVLTPVSQGLEKTIWFYLSNENRSHWIRSLIADNSSVEREELSDDLLDEKLQWQQPTLLGMGMLTCRVGDDLFLVKLYSERVTALALHELSLLSEESTSLPSPEWLGTSEVGQYYCSLYKIKAGRNVTKSILVESEANFRESLFLIEPPHALAQKYLRSKPTLAKRMDMEWFELVKIAVNSDEQFQAIETIEDNWKEICQMLLDIPVGFQFPPLKAQELWLEEGSDSIVLLHWEKWSLEPLGAGWPTHGDQLTVLCEAAERASLTRPILKNFSAQHFKLAALMAEFERLVIKQNLMFATRLLLPIQACIEQKEL